MRLTFTFLLTFTAFWAYSQCDFTTSVTSQDVTCSGANDGAAQLQVAGGVAPYTYTWGTGNTTAWVSNLAPGTYSVIVTDATGCAETVELIINEPPPVLINIDGNMIECGEEFASVDAVVTGGTLPYVYSWSNGSTGTNTTLYSGMYSFMVVDSNGCSFSSNFDVSAAISYDVDITPTSCDTADGAAEVVPTSDPTNLTYAWSTGNTGQTQTGLAQGWYSVTVADDTCAIHRNFYVDEDASCNVVIGGYVINDDTNPDCIEDADSEKIKNIMLTVNDSLVTYTDANGYYELTLDPGTYEIEVVLGNQYEALCPTSAIIAVDLPDGGVVSTDNNFYLKYAPYEDVCVTAIQGAARPGFNLSYILSICNYGGETVANGTVTFVHDSILLSPVFTPPADTYDPVTYTATWNYTDFEPNECLNISVTTTVPVGTQLGTIIDGQLTANPIATDDNPTNNIYEWHQIVTGSYDPNDKRGFIGNANEWGGDILEEDVRFNYNLRFQNVGTDTAFTVVVRDSLDLNVFDIESIQVGQTSHPYRLEFEDNNVLVFWFDNIHLVDSTANEPDSHGFATFTINRFPDLPIGTEIKNSAAIFFDFNAPVITNTTVHTISLPVSTTHPNLDITSNIYPNPITNETIVSYQLEKTETLSISIIDQLGQTCFTLLDNEQQSAGNHALSLRGEDLPSGLYLLQITTDEGQVCKKFVK